jgi:hypothetical protein
VLFENTPASLNGIIFTVIRRIVQELNRLADAIGKTDLQNIINFATSAPEYHELRVHGHFW